MNKKYKSSNMKFFRYTISFNGLITTLPDIFNNYFHALSLFTIKLIFVWIIIKFSIYVSEIGFESIKYKSCSLKHNFKSNLKKKK